jgi:hypothetical protein
MNVIPWFEISPPGWQGCQIFLVPTYQIGKIYTKVPQNIPNGNKIHQMDLKVPKRP